MRESRSYGSARGVAGDRYPYRDPSFCPTPDSIAPEPVPPVLEDPERQALKPIEGCTTEASETSNPAPRLFSAAAGVTRNGLDRVYSSRAPRRRESLLTFNRLPQNGYAPLAVPPACPTDRLC